ncbi:MAG: hypothetical protein LC720_09285, partial [Actinobacteria bacterium]|nr:hypothetical protein [Actinomycetota bacterium]
DGVDYLKLPSIRMVDRYRTWEPRDVGVDMATLTRMRGELIRDAVRRFRPHLLVADFMPAGPYGELLPALEELRRRRGVAVAGFRDIIDEPSFVRGLWEQTGVYEVLREHYAAVCVYGTPRVCDFAEYGLPDDHPHLHYAGYLVEAPAGKLPRQARGPAPLIVATTGGGVDGGPLLSRFVAAAGPTAAAGTWLVVAGPLLAEAEFTALRAAGAAAGVRVVRSVARMGALLAGADAVVSMAGYNATCELLACRTPAVVVPAARESQEQRLRGEALVRWGRAEVIDAGPAGPEALAAAIARALARGRPPPPPVALDGMTSTLDLFDRVAGGLTRSVPEGPP